MVEKVKAYLEKAKAFLKKVPKKVYIALVALVLAAAGVVVWMNTRPYAVLFADLNSSDMSSILSYLEDAGVTDYKIQENDTILVPPQMEESLRVRLLMENYPSSGFAYQYSGSSGMLSTESERRRDELRDLQDRLSATVRCFDGVKEAVVTINSGEDTSYVLDSNRVVNATASVFLTMHDGKKLSKEQAEAIRNLVAHAVKGLEVNSVNISDELGNQYNSSDAASIGEASALKIRLEEEQENKIRTEVLNVLIPWYGIENVKVGVNCTVDVDQTIEDSTHVYLPEWAEDGSTNGRGIVGSRIYNYVVVRDPNETAGGVVGTATNADFPEYVEDLPDINGNESTLELSGQVDYNNSETQKHVIRIAGYLTDCTVSVSINSTTAGNVDIENISRHVARAAGIVGVIDPATGEEYLGDRISVIAQPFYEPPAALPIDPADPQEMWIIYAAIAGVVLFLLLVIIIVLVLRRRKKKRLEAEEEARRAEELAAAGIDAEEIDAFLAATAEGTQDGENGDAGANVMNIQTERSVELRQEIRKFAEENPEIAAQMIKAWLKGEDD